MVGRMRRHLGRWASAYVLVVFLAISLQQYWHWQRIVELHQARSHGEPFVEHEFRATFWAGLFENLQSEWAQLLGQAILLLSPLAMVMWRAEQTADKQDVERLEGKLDRTLARLGEDPDG
jgi:hypothetical protein